MPKVCIICRKNKEKFNSEHIILATIGGSLEIDTVCKVCNSNLSKKFNEPFLKNPLIGIYRKQLNLRRSDERTGERGISNPLKNATIHGANANEYFVTYENGQPIAKRKPKVTLTKVDGGWQGQIIVSKQDLDRVKQDVFKKYGVDETKMTYTMEETKDPPLSFSILAPQASFLYEGLKIAYEFTVTIIPEYFEDEWAKLFSGFLHNGTGQDLIKQRIESINAVLPALEKEFKALSEIPLHIHAISLHQIEGLGLVCFVKLFDRAFPFLVSDKKYLSSADKEIGVYNDCIAKTHVFRLDLRWRDIRLHMDLVKSDEQEEARIREDLSKGNESISVGENRIPLFTKDGKSVINNLADAIPYTFAQYKLIDFARKSILFNVTLPQDEFFIKHQPTNKLIELLGFEASYEIVL